MARYYFNVYNSSGLVEDEEGRDLTDMKAVRREAMHGVRSLLADEVLQGRLDLRGRLEVLDDSGRSVLALHFEEALEIIHDPVS